MSKSSKGKFFKGKFKNKKTVKWLVAVFLFWRAALCLFAFLGQKWLPLRTGYLGKSIWANFDGIHYLIIAERGYLQFQQAFFPFYPFLIRWLGRIFFKNYLFSGLLISHLSFLVALYLLFKLIRLDFSEKITKRSLLYLLIFPTSFFFGSVYTESLFLALILGAFYAARKKKWLLAGLLGAFASATRFVGIFLFPALLLEWYQENEKLKKKKLKNLAPLFLILSGLLFYMWYLKKSVGDPLFFIHVQPFFGAQRTGGKLILPYQVFWRYLKMLVTVQKMTPTYLVVVSEFLVGLGFLILSVWAYFKLRLSYFVFMVLSYLTPGLTGTFSSLPRYALIFFPGFILLSLAAEKYRWLKIGYPIVAGLLLIICVFLFTRGFWVA